MTQLKIEREKWLDYVRAFACILVVLGHEEESIFSKNIIISYLLKTIYHFHVYVFFFFSGYLFQKSFSGFFEKDILKKLYDILI